jgi:hypothetical protein
MKFNVDDDAENYKSCLYVGLWMVIVLALALRCDICAISYSKRVQKETQMMNLAGHKCSRPKLVRYMFNCLGLKQSELSS